MVRPSVVLPALCLSASATATLQRKWTNGDTATGTTGGSVIEGCEYWINDLDTGDSCKSIEAYFGITEKQFLSWVRESIVYLVTRSD